MSAELAVAPGLAVAVSYRLELDGGVIESKSDQPVWFVHGEPGLTPKLQQALLGLRAGARVSVRLDPADGFGEYDPKLVQQLPRAHFTEAEPLAVGKRLTGRNEQGVSLEALVVALTPSTVTVDFNSSHAGVPVTAVVQVLEVRAKPPTR